MDAQTISEALHGKRSGKGYKARCPTHDDKTPSLSITDSDKGVLVHCHAGCTFNEVSSELRNRGLWPDATPAQKEKWKEKKRQERIEDAQLTKDIGDAMQERGEPFQSGDSEMYNQAKQTLNEEGIRDNIQIVSIRDFISQELPERECLLSPWLPKQGLAMLHAPRGIGKTYVSLSVAYAVASGSTFLNWQAKRPAGVLFLDGEMPAIALQERLDSLIKANEQDTQAPLKLMTPDLQPKDRPAFNIADEYDQVELEGHLENIELIIVDNIATLCRSGKENEAEGWKPIQEWALRQRARGRSVLFVHHSGKDGRQRGTSGREDVLDTTISLRHPSDYTQEQGARFEVKFEKARGFYGPDAEPIEAQLVTDEHNRQAWTYRPLEESIYDQIVELYKDGLKPNEIAQETGRHKSRVSRHLKKARMNGDIK